MAGCRRIEICPWNSKCHNFVKFLSPRYIFTDSESKWFRRQRTNRVFSSGMLEGKFPNKVLAVLAYFLPYVIDGIDLSKHINFADSSKYQLKLAIRI